MKKPVHSFSLAATAQAVLIFVIKCYQKTHIFRPPSCRFYPTCSEYAVGSIRRFGALYGLLTAFWRICKCHPWNDGGVDLLPDAFMQPKVNVSFSPRSMQKQKHN